MPVYGKTTQFSTADTSPLLDEHATTSTSNIWHFLYYAHAFDPTILPSLKEISNQQARPTENTMKAFRQLMDYIHMHPKAFIHFNAGDMILSQVSDSACLVQTDARSCCATLYTLTDFSTSKPSIIKAYGPV